MKKRVFMKTLSIMLVLAMIIGMMPSMSFLSQRAYAKSNNIALGKNVTGTGQNLNNLVDENASTYWEGSSDTSSTTKDTITIDLGDSYNIKEVILDFNFDGDLEQPSFKSTDILISTEADSNYQNAGKVTAEETAYISLNLTGNPIKGRFVKLENIEGNEHYLNTKPQITGVTVFGEQVSEGEPSGAGTEEHPYLITTPEHLLWIEENNSDDFSGIYFKQTTNIDMVAVDDFTPIGSSEIFNGKYDGNSKKISNLNIDTTTSIAGLFGYIGSDGEVSNLTLENANIKASSGKSVSAGGIAGENEGKIKNCHITATESKNSIISANGDNSFAGGIVGVNLGVISMCSSVAEIMGSGNLAAGGIAGAIEGGTIRDCISTGQIRNIVADTEEIYLGGISGYIIEGTIEHCISTGTIALTGESGIMNGITGVSSNSDILNNYFLQDTASNGYYDFDENDFSNVGAEPKSLEELKNPNTFKFSDGWDPNTWIFTMGQLPRLGGIMDDSDVQAVIDDKAALDSDDFTYAGTDNAAAVTQNFTVPTAGSNGTTITWAEKADPGNNISISGGTVTVTRPTNGQGDKTVTLTATITKNAASDTKDITITIKQLPASNGGGSGSSGGGSSSSGSSNTSSPTPTPAPTGNNANIVVNGQTQTNMATAKTEQTPSGQTKTTVTVDANKLNEVLSKLPDSPVNSGAVNQSPTVISIPVAENSDVVVGELNGQMVKDMESKAVVMEIKTEAAVYTLPAQQIDISAVSRAIGQDVKLADIKVQIEIAKPNDPDVKVVEDSAIKGNFSLVVPPVEFNITCTYGDRTVDVSQFNSFVERSIALPDGIDPSKITTAIVVDSDGTTRHVPTKIVVIDGKYFAKINSLTNSTYSVIWHPIEFKDVEKHWAKNAVNDMGSRMVIGGMGNDNFDPDRDITRAEFASIIVRALGLKPGVGTNPFSDVADTDWYTDNIKTAVEYKLIAGYEDGTFGPMDKITREQAMSMIARAMKITGLNITLDKAEAEKILASFADEGRIANYAINSIIACVKAGIASGKNGNLISPIDNITRAEVAVMISRLLQKSDLI